MFGNRSPEGDVTTASGASHAPFSVIGGDVTIVGDITSQVDLHIDGRIEGDVSCATLVQGSGSVITGKVTAKTARIAGLVEGPVDAGRLIAERGARINGDCRYQSFDRAADALITGQLLPKVRPVVVSVTPIATVIPARGVASTAGR